MEACPRVQLELPKVPSLDILGSMDSSKNKLGFLNYREIGV